MALKKAQGGQLVLPKVLALGESHRLIDPRVGLVAVGEERVGVCGGLQDVLSSTCFPMAISSLD